MTARAIQFFLGADVLGGIGRVVVEHDEANAGVRIAEDDAAAAAAHHVPFDDRDVCLDTLLVLVGIGRVVAEHDEANAGARTAEDDAAASVVHRLPADDRDERFDTSMVLPPPMLVSVHTDGDSMIWVGEMD